MLIIQQFLAGRPLGGLHKKLKCTWSPTILVIQKYGYCPETILVPRNFYFVLITSP